MAKKAKTDTDVERHVSRGTLKMLLKASAVCSSEMGASRERYGAQVEKAEKGGLNKFAFGVVQKLWKQDAVKAAHNIRALLLYIDLLGLDAQGDLEDAINDADEDREGATTH